MSYMHFSELICLNHNSANIIPVSSGQNLGRADVLGLLLPALNGKPLLNAVNEQYIDNIDQAMETDTVLMLQHLQIIFEQACGLYKVDSDFEVELTNINKWIVVTATSSCCTALFNKKLNRLLNEDKKFTDLFNWLQPNYIGMVHSLEMLNFAKLYATERQFAHTQYQHFEQHNNGLRCKLAYRSGLLTIAWCSPVQCFLFKSNE